MLYMSSCYSDRICYYTKMSTYLFVEKQCVNTRRHSQRKLFKPLAKKFKDLNSLILEFLYVHQLGQPEHKYSKDFQLIQFNVT